ncbi:MAG: hypothetical protein KBD12_00320 [Candidatus Pacebacteria bacterium]|nr:hypothetical protein [Candidatus Paceibacterota bacterium]
MSQIVTISGVSGSGKTTLLEFIKKDYISIFYPTSLTTKALSERDLLSAKKYISLSSEDFLKKIDEDFFLEFQKVHNDYYGTPKSCLRQAFIEEKDIVLDIDLKGALFIKNNKDLEYEFKVISFFVWRDINPLSDFSIKDLFLSVENNIKSRQKIEGKELFKRQYTAVEEYFLAKENEKSFIFIENVNNNLLSFTQNFKDKYTPTFYR